MEQPKVVIDELKDEKNLVKRDILLQKYGIIPPKLTKKEKLDIAIELAQGAE